MTTKDVAAAINRIVARAHDDEAAHEAEDSLHRAVLHEVVAGNPEAAEMARLALTTSTIKFARWYT